MDRGSGVVACSYRVGSSPGALIHARHRRVCQQLFSGHGLRGPVLEQLRRDEPLEPGHGQPGSGGLLRFAGGCERRVLARRRKGFDAGRADRQHLPLLPEGSNAGQGDHHPVEWWDWVRHTFVRLDLHSQSVGRLLHVVLRQPPNSDASAGIIGATGNRAKRAPNLQDHDRQRRSLHRKPRRSQHVHLSRPAAAAGMRLQQGAPGCHSANA